MKSTKDHIAGRRMFEKCQTVNGRLLGANIRH